MSITVNLHRATKVTANTKSGLSWIELAADDGSSVAAFMPHAAAVAMAQAFTSAMTPEPEVLRIIAEEAE